MADARNDLIELTSTETEEESSNFKNSPFTDQSGVYSQMSELHARSFNDEKVTGRYLWEDEHGNKLMAANLKGRPPKDVVPYLEKDKHSRLGIRTHWMCDTTDVERTVEVSDFMRENHLPTERITKKSRITKIEIKGRLMESGEFKGMLLTNNDTIGEEKLKFMKYLNEVDYYEVQREMPVDERIEDLKKKGDIDGAHFKNKLKTAFKYLKLVEGIDLDIENKNDLKLFLTDILPKRMGVYLGRFHDLGLRHTYPGSKNWILIGALVDLDSVHGPPFGEAESTDEEVQRDIDETFEAVTSVFRTMIEDKGYGFVWSLWGDKSEDVKEATRTAIKNYINAYKEQRGVSTDFMNKHLDQQNLMHHEVELT